MKSVFVVSIFALLAGCSGMNMSSGSSGFNAASYSSGSLSYDESVLQLYAGGN